MSGVVATASITPVARSSRVTSPALRCVRDRRGGVEHLRGRLREALRLDVGILGRPGRDVVDVERRHEQADEDADDDQDGQDPTDTTHDLHARFLRTVSWRRRRHVQG
jgi:hypothetical protein